MKKSEKTFDAVHMMRQIRDRLSEQCKNMTFEEQQQYIKERLSDQEPPRTHRAHPIAPSRA